MIGRETKGYLHAWWVQWLKTGASTFPSVVASYAAEFVKSAGDVCNCDEWHDEDE